MPRRTNDEGFEPRRPKREVFVKRDCKLCKDQITIDYKQADLLKKFMTERGKIISSRLSGNCAMHQRQLARAIKRARTMLLVR
jgi:small subunit ribosomal protein S18